jgi:D-sedoheptulose 7-phosphate isomerase
MIGSTMDTRTYLGFVQKEMEKLDTAQIQAMADAIYERYQTGRFVYIIGNGGSGANASHLCEDLGKSTVDDFESQKRLKVLSLTDNTPYILAWANDTSYDRVFVEQLKNFGQAGDLLIAISGSGNSPNILKAVEWA